MVSYTQLNIKKIEHIHKLAIFLDIKTNLILITKFKYDKI
jgi:hypothetical protein